MQLPWCHAQKTRLRSYPNLTLNCITMFQNGNNRLLRTLGVASVLIPASSHINATDWFQFRGPNAQGVAAGRSYAITLNTNTLAWRIPVPRGMSSPVILKNESVVLTGVKGPELVTLCLDGKRGTVNWQCAVRPPVMEQVHPLSSQAAATPATDGENTFVYFGSVGVLAYDKEGKETWRKELPDPHNRNGAASSPILYGNSVLQVVDSSEAGKSFLIALNSQTGETQWKVDRPFAPASWSTPILWKTSRGDELLVQGGQRLDGYDPKTGLLLWWLGGFPDGITVPVVSSSLVIASSFGLGSVREEGIVPSWDELIKGDFNHDGKLDQEELRATGAGSLIRKDVPRDVPGNFFLLADLLSYIDPKGEALDKDKWENFNRSFIASTPKSQIVAIREGARGDAANHVLWKVDTGISEIPSPIIYKDLMYAIRNGGILWCRSAKDGSKIFNERIPHAGGLYYASPIIALDETVGPHLILVSERGVVSAIPLNKPFEPNNIRQMDLSERVTATPALSAAGAFVIRGESRVYCFRPAQKTRPLGLQTSAAYFHLALHRAREKDRQL